MQDGLLPRPQPGARSLQRCLPRSFSPDRRPVQHVPHDVLQESQHQGEAQEEGRPASRRASTETPLAAQTRFDTIPSTNRAYAASPPSPSLESYTPPASRHQRPPIRRGRARRPSHTRGTSSSLSTPLRSVSRSRTPTPPRFSETLSSQFLGGRVEAHAYLLTRAHPPPTPPLSPEPVTGVAKPISQHSLESPSSSRPSDLSDQSTTSSFAYFLRSNRSDRRLFKKRSRPTQHQEKAAVVKRPEPPRSNSYYKPRIVEDSATPSSASPIAFDSPRSSPTARDSPRASPRTRDSSKPASTPRSRSSSRQSIRWKQSTEANLSPTLTSKWSQILFESKPLGHVKDFSTPISPLTRPRSFRRTISTPQDERQMDSEASFRGQYELLSPYTSIPGVKSERRKAEDVPKRMSLTRQPALSWLPSEMKRVPTPPLPEDDSKKHSAIRSFFNNIRHQPSETSSIETPPSARLPTQRRKPILPTKSLQNLLSKFSITTLRHKISHRDIDNAPVESRDPLKVTQFEQTPFSQRYGDTRRDEMNRFRSYLDEALREDDDDDGSMATFEFDAPDHLPNSPLCPLSPKHKSGGKGICPLHGRKKSSAPTRGSRTETKRQKTGPMIVYDSGEVSAQSHGTWKIDLDDEMARAMRA